MNKIWKLLAIFLAKLFGKSLGRMLRKSQARLQPSRSTPSRPVAENSTTTSTTSTAATSSTASTANARGKRKSGMRHLHVPSIVFASILLGSLLSPIIYSGFRHIFSSFQKTVAERLSEQDQRTAIELQDNYRNIYERVNPSVVFIKTNVLVRSGGFWFDFYRQGEQAGSGFIIDADGYVVTNNHVVKGAQKIEVIFYDNRKETAQLVGRDESSDVALIKINASPDLQPAILGDSDKVAVGQIACALGAPFGLERTFTVGIISAKQRSIDQTKYSRIQTDAAINFGNSGGPLINVYGEVVGINQSIFSPGGGGNVGIGFAIPINEAKDVIAQLRKSKRVIGKPALGVQIGAISDRLRKDLQLGDLEGVIVIQVIPGSAAQQAGLREYDFITKMNGQMILEPKDLISVVQKSGIGSKVAIELMRKGQLTKIEAKIGEAPAQ